MDKPHIKLNFNRELSLELKYGIQNNILHLDIPIENSKALFSVFPLHTQKTITVNFEIIDILGRDGFNIKKVFVSEIKNDKDNLLQSRNKNK